MARRLTDPSYIWKAGRDLHLIINGQIPLIEGMCHKHTSVLEDVHWGSVDRGPVRRRAERSPPTMATAVKRSGLLCACGRGLAEDLSELSLYDSFHKSRASYTGSRRIVTRGRDDREPSTRHRVQ